jgi:hypothetical protein
LRLTLPCLAASAMRVRRKKRIVCLARHIERGHPFSAFGRW